MKNKEFYLCIYLQFPALQPLGENTSMLGKCILHTYWFSHMPMNYARSTTSIVMQSHCMRKS